MGQTARRRAPELPRRRCAGLHGDKQLYAGGYGDAVLDAWAPRERWPVRGSRA